MNEEPRFDWWKTVQVGLLGGVVALLISLVGLVQAADRRAIIPNVLS